MKTIIIYGSQYGTTKRYAEYLSEMTGIEDVAFKEAKDIDRYDRVIFMGALCKHEVCPAPRHGAHGCSLPSETLPLFAVPMGHAHRFHSLSRRSRTTRCRMMS